MNDVLDELSSPRFASDSGGSDGICRADSGSSNFNQDASGRVASLAQMIFWAASRGGTKEDLSNIRTEQR